MSSKAKAKPKLQLQHDGLCLFMAPGSLTGYRCITMCSNSATARKYEVRISHDGRKRFVAGFATAVEAAYCYACWKAGVPHPMITEEKLEWRDEPEPMSAADAERLARLEGFELKQDARSPTGFAGVARAEKAVLGRHFIATLKCDGHVEQLGPFKTAEEGSLRYARRMKQLLYEEGSWKSDARYVQQRKADAQSRFKARPVIKADLMIQGRDAREEAAKRQKLSHPGENAEPEADETEGVEGEEGEAVSRMTAAEALAAAKAEGLQLEKMAHSQTGYRGVAKSGTRFEARLSIGKKQRVHLGNFVTKEEAALVRARQVSRQTEPHRGMPLPRGPTAYYGRTTSTAEEIVAAAVASPSAAAGSSFSAPAPAAAPAAAAPVAAPDAAPADAPVTAPGVGVGVGVGKAREISARSAEISAGAGSSVPSQGKGKGAEGAGKAAQGGAKGGGGKGKTGKGGVDKGGSDKGGGGKGGGGKGGGGGAGAAKDKGVGTNKGGAKAVEASPVPPSPPTAHPPPPPPPPPPQEGSRIPTGAPTGGGIDTMTKVASIAALPDRPNEIKVNVLKTAELMAVLPAAARDRKLIFLAPRHFRPGLLATRVQAMFSLAAPPQLRHCDSISGRVEEDLEQETTLGHIYDARHTSGMLHIAVL